MNKKYTYIIFIALILLSLPVSGCLNSIQNEPDDQTPEENQNTTNNKDEKTSLKDNNTVLNDENPDVIIKDISINEKVFKGEYYNVSVFVKINKAKETNYEIKIKNKTNQVIKSRKISISNEKTRKIDFKLFANETGEKKIISGNHSQSYQILDPKKNLECKFIIAQNSYMTSNYFQLNISGINGEYKALIKNPSNKTIDQKQINTAQIQEKGNHIIINVAKNKEISEAGQYKAYIVDDREKIILSSASKIEPAKPEIINIELTKTYEQSSKGEISDIKIKLKNYGDISTKLNEGIIKTNGKKRSLNLQTEKIIKPNETTILSDNVYITDLDIGTYNLRVELFYHSKLISKKETLFQITKDE